MKNVVYTSFYGIIALIVCLLAIWAWFSKPSTLSELSGCVALTLLFLFLAYKLRRCFRKMTEGIFEE